MTGHAVVEVDGQPLSLSGNHDPSVRLSVVVPTYDEASNIEALLRGLHRTLSATGVGFEMIVVDDDSPDRTWEVAGALVDDLPELRVLRRRGASGLATAVTCGWAHARGELLGVIDGDGQHPPEVVASLL
ncbi:MAG: glycosyltransferase, partial [Actinomycetota bacterium]|nr:glycosyltransferase [Actinomycetota bacterium]